MNAGNSSRIELLRKDNFDTWKLQMQAVLIKGDLWEYVSGTCVKPEATATNAAAIAEWVKNDSKARSDIVLSISPTELKQIKNCDTSRSMWLRLEEIYQSKGPARKATLLKSLILCKMDDGGDVREHLREFFDSVDKLNDMDVDIYPDLLAILLIYSLRASFEVFRCAIESRDDLPSPEALRIKVVEESDARKNCARGGSGTSGVMVANKNGGWRDNKNGGWRDNKNSGWRDNKERAEAGRSPNGRRNNGGSKLRCFKCGRLGHKASECRSKERSAKHARNVCLRMSEREETANSSSDWCLDSGASAHLCNDGGQFTKIDRSKTGILNLANESSTATLGVGTVQFAARVLGETANVSLSETLHVPDLRTNLMSVSKITDRGLEVNFRRDEAVVVDPDGNVLLCAERIGDLYYVSGHKHDARSACGEDKIPLGLLHKRSGHANARDLVEAIRNNRVSGVQLKDCAEAVKCDICIQGKLSRSPFPKCSNRRTEQLLDLVHTDVCGPMRTPSLGGAKYFVEFIDDKSRWCETRFLKSKDEVFQATTEYLGLVENQTGKTVKCLQSDNGGEYTSRDFDRYLKARGITRRLTAPYNPEQNGIAERKNRTLLDTARCLLIDAGLPDSFWAEAVNTANYLRNRLPTRCLGGGTPYEAWTGKKPDISNFRAFGSRVYYLDRRPGKGKFDPRGEEGVFLGYADESKAYRIWSPVKRTVLISRDVVFVEDDKERRHVDNPAQTQQSRETSPEVRRSVEIVHPPPAGGAPPATVNDPRNVIEVEVEVHRPADVPDGVYADGESNDRSERDVTTAEEDDERDIIDDDNNADRARAPGRPRIVRTGRRGRPRKQFRTVPNPGANIVDVIEQSFVSEVAMKKALSGPDADEWRRAIVAELTSIIKNDTFALVERPQRDKVVGSRIVLRNKYKSDGTFERRKARLVAQGFSQQPGIHFTETFAPVARFSSIRLMASLAARHDMAIKQFDVETAYLNGELNEEVFMEPPKELQRALGSIIDNETDSSTVAKATSLLQELRKGDRVCLLKKSLYGLRQAGRNWYTKLDSTLKELGAIPTASDPCLFRLKSGRDVVLIAIYVDDILIASRNRKKIAEIGRELAQRFEIKALGDVKHCLGVEFQREDGRVTMHQRGYIKDVLSRFGMSDCKPVATPIDLGTKLEKNIDQSQEDLALPYRELVGALIYLSSTTRPDIAFAVSRLGQFNNCYGPEHWRAAKRVLRYLKGTMNVGLAFGADDGPIRAFADADWGASTEDRRSYTGYVFLLNGGPLSWEAKKQRTVALSTTEAEYMALSECVKEGLYLQRFLRELGFDDLANLVIHCDNRSCLQLAENPTFHGRSKHIDIRHHFVRDVLKNGQVRVSYVPTDDQVADFLTKGLSKPKHVRCAKSCGLDVVD
ncbi:hypothetical protein Zmor_005987 [Zophobas morio]|uniref:Retrovirus-related Pol polyprotein from transposon TNT 1-94 n=2 Tax=Zophobas morio TaxID=2755281 RepID=A0AA38MN66_9CUCU|nr:hypothetical protein Zmor_005987 [Zophobas morio]